MPRPPATPETRSVRLLKVGEQVRHIISDLLMRQQVHDTVLSSHAVSVTERQRFILRVRTLARGVAEAYTRMELRLRDLNAWINVPTKGDAFSSQRWHRDLPEDHDIVKVFLYVRDVPEGAGPLSYVTGSHTTAGRRVELPTTFDGIGYRIDSFFLSDHTGRLQGGLFGLDGIHPTTSGYGLVAQQVLDLIGLSRAGTTAIDFAALRLKDTLNTQPPALVSPLLTMIAPLATRFVSRPGT